MLEDSLHLTFTEVQVVSKILFSSTRGHSLHKQKDCCGGRWFAELLGEGTILRRISHQHYLQLLLWAETLCLKVHLNS